MKKWIILLYLLSSSCRDGARVADWEARVHYEEQMLEEVRDDWEYQDSIGTKK